MVFLCDPAAARTSDLVICIYDDDDRTVTAIHCAVRPKAGDTFEYQGVTWELERWVEKPEGKAWVAKWVRPARRHSSSGGLGLPRGSANLVWVLLRGGLLASGLEALLSLTLFRDRFFALFRDWRMIVSHIGWSVSGS